MTVYGACPQTPPPPARQRTRRKWTRLGPFGGLLMCLFIAAIAVVLPGWNTMPSFFPSSSTSSSLSTTTTTTSTTAHDSCPPVLPQHLHLAQRSNVNTDGRVSMTLSFTVPPSNSSNSSNSTNYAVSVLYGQGMRPEGVIEIPSYDDSVIQRFTYRSDYTRIPYTSDWIYHVPLPHLQAGRQLYWYKIRIACNNNIPLTSKLRRLQQKQQQAYKFRTPPLPGSPFRMALVGDLGQTENSTRTIRHVQHAAGTNQDSITHVMIAGDMSYADSDPYRWPSWFRLVEPLSRSVPVHTAAGNHEIECDTQTRDIFVPYQAYFRNPNMQPVQQQSPISTAYRKTLWRQSCAAPSQFLGRYAYGNSFYSYVHGLAHIVVLNSYTYSSVGSPQYNWFKEELEQRVDRTVTPWLLVLFHCPLYTTFVGHVDEIQSLQMKRAMEPLFLQYGVNIVVNGHDHAYMRTHPVYQNRQNDMAPVYLILGAGGNREHHSRGFRNHKPEPWVAARTMLDYGYGHLYVPNATHAQFHWIRDGVSVEGIDDRVWLRNRHSLD